MNARELGLFHKFNVTRTDGKSSAGEKHDGCDYFVLDLTHDKHAWPTLAAYAEACANEYPALAADLNAKLRKYYSALNHFITVPEVTLPNGIIVPTFQAGKFLTTKGPADTPLIDIWRAPWVDINFHDAKRVAKEAELNLITETQALAIAWDASQQDINWTGGKVGEGAMYQGLHKGTFDSAQPANLVSDDPEERRWLELSNGERIFDFAGNAYTWVIDDVQGDENGMTTIIKADSISLTTAPYPALKNGMGWRPTTQVDWSGYALVRGGCWCSVSFAGAFYLVYDWPDVAFGYVGFRCTK